MKIVGYQIILRITRFFTLVIRPDYQKFCLRSTPDQQKAMQIILREPQMLHRPICCWWYRSQYIRIHYSGAMKKVCVRFQISARSVRRMISMSAGWTGPASVSERSARRTRFALEVNRLLVYFFWYPRQATIIIAWRYVSVFLNGTRTRNMSVSMENHISRHTWTVFCKANLRHRK